MRFWLQYVHCRIFKVGLRITLLGMYEDREFRRVAKEEYGCIVKYPIPITLFCVKFEGKASRISGRVRRALLTADRGEARNAFGSLSNVTEHIHRSLIQFSTATMGAKLSY